MAKREKVIIVEKFAGGPLGGGVAQLSLCSFHQQSSSITPRPAPTTDHVRCCLAGGCGGRP